jgi:hypothetical protein
LDSGEVGFRERSIGVGVGLVFLEDAMFFIINPRKPTASCFLYCLSLSSFGSVSYFFSIFFSLLGYYVIPPNMALNIY